MLKKLALLFVSLCLILAGAVPAQASEKTYRIDVDDDIVSIVEAYDVTLDGNTVKQIVAKYRGNSPAAVELGKLGAKARTKKGMKLLTVRGRTPSGYPRHKFQATFVLDGDGKPASLFRTRGMGLDEKWVSALGFLSEVQVRKGSGVPADWYGALVRQGPKLIGLRHVNPDRWTLTRLTERGPVDPPTPGEDLPANLPGIIVEESPGCYALRVELPECWIVLKGYWSCWPGYPTDEPLAKETQGDQEGEDPTTWCTDCNGDVVTVAVVFVNTKTGQRYYTTAPYQYRLD